MKKYLLFLFAMMMICGYSFGQTYLTESFEGTWSGTLPAPSGWTQTHPSGTDSEAWEKSVWTTVWTPAGNGTKPTGTPYGSAVAHFNDYNSSSGNVFRLESGDIDLSTSSNPRVGFYYFYNLGSAVLRVWASDNGGSSWTNISGSIAATGASWTKLQYNLSGYKTGNARIALEVTSAYGSHDLWLDNVVVDETPAPMAGTYTIDPAGSGTRNFTTFSAAIAAINDAGISASVTFNVASGAVFTEDCPPLTATGTSGSQIVFQKSGILANPVIKPTGGTATNDAGIKIAGGDYITFDGIDITISTGPAVEYGYFIYNVSASNGAQYNTIKNAKITLNRSNTSSRGIYQYVLTTPTAATGANSYNKFQGMTIQNSYQGIYITGNATYPDLSTEVSACVIGAATANDIGNGSSTLNGIRITSSSGANVFGNEVRNLTITGASTVYGIYLESVQGTCSVYNNNVHDVKSTSTSASSLIYGIRTDINSTHTCNVYNNFVSALEHGIITANVTVVIRSIATGVSGAGTGNFFFNSVRIAEDAAPSSTAFYVGANGTVNAKDNIFANFSTAGATSLRYCIFKASGSTLNNVNYNDYYINTSGTGNNVGSFNAANLNTLELWQTATGKDANSKNADPVFTNPTDLHSASSILNNAGITISITNGDALDITKDIDGETRTSTPDIGADEFAINDMTSKAEIPGAQVTGTTVASTITTVGSAVEVFRFQITDMGSGDGLATKVTNIRIQNANPANGASWTANIAGSKLNDGTSDITIGTPVITASYIDVPITAGNLDVANGTSKTITMSIYLKTSGIEDGKKLQFTIPATGHGFTAAGSGSLFSADFGAAVTSNEHTIAVEATQLVFGTIPSNVLINANFIVTVNASDANGNPDTDNNSSVTLSKSTGTGLLSSVTGLVQSLSGGTYTWADVQYNTSGIFKIQAAASLLTPVISGDITASNEAQIGTGTSLSQAYPFDVYWGFSRNSALYTTSEIGAYRVIEKLSWQIATAQTTVCPVKIYLKKTTATTVVADTWANMIAGATLVYDGPVQFTPTGWFSFNLSAPFNYDADNLLVLTEGNYGGGGTATYPTFYYTPATTMNANIHTDNTPPTASLAVGNNRPNIKISFQQPMEYISSTATQAVTSPIMLSGINQEIIGLQIVTNGTGSPLTVSSFDFSSAGTTDPDNDLVTARLWSTGSSPVFATTLQVGNAYSGPWGSFSITSGSNLPFTLSGGTNYFWLTYDVSGTATVGNLTDAQFNGVVVGGNPYTPTVQDPLGSRTIKGPLSGNYTIGVAKSSDYSSLTGINGFFADVNSLGLAANVTATIVTDLVEDGTFPLSQWTESGAGNYSLTIQPNEAVNKTISGSYASGLIRLNGADRVTVDGSYNGSGRYLSFSNTNAGTSSAVIWIFSTSASNGATNNTIKNCNLTGNSSNTTLACIVSSSGATIGGVAEAQNNNNTYQNNIIKKSFYGIAVVGPSGNETGVLIADNSIGSTTFADKIGLVGIGLYQQSGTVSGNSIFGVTTASTSTASGILVAGSTSNITIKENSITDVKNTNTVGWGSNGMQLNSSSTTANVTIINNMISDVASYGYSLAGVGDNGYGIIAVSGGGYNIYFNSINLNTNQSALLGLPSAINITSGITGAGSIDLRNNIIANTQTFGTDRYAIYCAAASTVFSNIDYNDYYTTGPNLGYLGETILDLPAWQTATGMDEKSISGDPKFIDPTNLHINTAVISPVSAAGKEIESVVADIDGDLRNNPPDIGADEFLRAGPATIVSTVVGCPGTLVVVPVIVNNFTNIGTISLTLDYNPAVLTFQGLTTSSIPSTWDTNYQASSGRFILGGFGPGLTLPNGSVLFNLTFMYHGGTSGLTWFDDDGISCEYSDATTLEPLLDLPFSTYYTNGTVSQQKTLYLSLFLEGIYIGEHQMRKAQNDIGDQFGGDTADMITVELHNVLAYSDPPAYIDGNVKLGTNGQAMVCIPDGYNDFYYITIKHRNSIETTTATAVSFSGSSIIYSFDEPSKAYGDNLAVFIDGTAAIYAGDENQDDIVDGSDLSDVANLVPTAPCGYIKEDINGDGLIDGSDLSITGNNSAFAIIAITP